MITAECVNVLGVSLVIWLCVLHLAAGHQLMSGDKTGTQWDLSSARTDQQLWLWTPPGRVWVSPPLVSCHLTPASLATSSSSYWSNTSLGPSEFASFTFNQSTEHCLTPPSLQANHDTRNRKVLRSWGGKRPACSLVLIMIYGSFFLCGSPINSPLFHFWSGAPQKFVKVSLRNPLHLAEAFNDDIQSSWMSTITKSIDLSGLSNSPLLFWLSIDHTLALNTALRLSVLLCHRMTRSPLFMTIFRLIISASCCLCLAVSCLRLMQRISDREL